MTRTVPSLGLLTLAAAAIAVAVADPIVRAQPPRGALLLEGARLSPGDGSPPIERAALVLDQGRIVAVGKAGSVKTPDGARRIDLTGKTIMPALVDGHVHLGYQVGLSFSADNYTRATLIDQLNRYAYDGISAVLSMGTDAGTIPEQLRAD